MNSIVFLLLSLAIILAGAEVFTNGVEWLGKKLDLSDGAVGSILAAVGTALPETLIPLIAILFGSKEMGSQIGIGAILGAPLMLSTLAMFVTGLAVVGFSRRRLKGNKVTVDQEVIRRDLGFFLLVFTAAILAGILPMRRGWQLAIGGFMVLSYILYAYVTLTTGRNDGNHDEDLRCCYFAPRQDEPGLNVVVLQVLAALAVIIAGAHTFVGAVTEIAEVYRVPAFALSIIIAPIATELPEKFNSVIWISRDKDTLALGNISGAMAFQSSLIPALGIFLTSWQLSAGAMVSAILALVAAGFLYIQVARKGHLSAYDLLWCGAFYGIFLVGVFDGIIR
ncbi:MAG: sodium:calcium antiporter [Syntrophomonadaceae bacterium]|nr:sodium:calcium antiporter [Syntrophomonadaceae bacterium]